MKPPPFDVGIHLNLVRTIPRHRALTWTAPSCWVSATRTPRVYARASRQGCCASNVAPRMLRGYTPDDRVDNSPPRTPRARNSPSMAYPFHVKHRVRGRHQSHHDAAHEDAWLGVLTRRSAQRFRASPSDAEPFERHDADGDGEVSLLRSCGDRASPPGEHRAACGARLRFQMGSRSHQGRDSPRWSRAERGTTGAKAPRR